MAKSLKTNGLRELASFKSRVIRQHQLERISAKDKNELLGLVHKLETKVVEMTEWMEEGDEW